MKVSSQVRKGTIFKFYIKTIGWHVNFEENQNINAFWEWGIGNWEWKEGASQLGKFINS